MEHILGQQYTIFRRVAPYTPTRSCVHIGVLKTKTALPSGFMLLNI
jgi:hypothetical protein